MFSIVKLIFEISAKSVLSKAILFDSQPVNVNPGFAIASNVTGIPLKYKPDQFSSSISMVFNLIYPPLAGEIVR